MISSVGPNLPLPLLEATGCYAGPLTINVDRAMPKADLLETKFALWTRSVLEDWADGAFDGYETVVFSRGDDNAQRLYYYICELRRQKLIGGPEPVIFDVAMVRRATSLAHMEVALRSLAARFGVQAEDLAAAMQKTQNHNATSTEQGASVCLLIGTPPPDCRLHNAISKGGMQPEGPILPEIWAASPKYEGYSNGDPFALLASSLHSSTLISRSFSEPAVSLKSRLGKGAVKAAVLWCSEDDEAIVWHVPAMQQVLAEAGVPTLVLTRRDWAGQDGAVQEIEAFTRENAA
ncbi:MAG: hypothetical protein ACK5NN_05480 [Sphingomonadaceae bacterium]